MLQQKYYIKQEEKNTPLETQQYLLLMVLFALEKRFIPSHVTHVSVSFSVFQFQCLYAASLPVPCVILSAQRLITYYRVMRRVCICTLFYILLLRKHT